MVLTATELTAMRAELTATLPSSCVIERATSTPNDSGGHTNAWATLSTVACRVAPIGGREAIVAGQIAAESDHVITVPALTAIETTDRIVEFSEVYEVTHVSTRSEELVRRVFVQRVT